jgi:hypothetical protein
MIAALRNAYRRYRLGILRERRRELREWVRAVRIQAACSLGHGDTNDAARWTRAGDAAEAEVRALTREVDGLEDEIERDQQREYRQSR